jgi:hypothetical protein
MAGCHNNLGRNVTLAACGVSARKESPGDRRMNAIIYLVGVVVVVAILSFIGLREPPRPPLPSSRLFGKFFRRTSK